MNLYIRVQNEQTIGNPAFEDNLLQAFPDGIPFNWESFVRVECPTPNVYQILESDIPTYAKVNGVWTDVWSLRDMTNEEKLAKQQLVIDELNAREDASNWSTWILDEATCTMKPPFPRPDATDGKVYRWCGADNNWKETPARPEGEYKFDFIAWAWVAI
jgi:hypothetical protein